MEGKTEAAVAALKKARNSKTDWTDDAWKKEMLTVLIPFREGVSHGGPGRFKENTPTEKVGQISTGQQPAAVGALAESGVGAKTEGITSVAVGISDVEVAGLPRVPYATPVSPLGSIAGVGIPGLRALRGVLCIEKPSRLIGGGAFGQVYEMTAVPAIGGQSPTQVAVKVLRKLVFTKRSAVERDEFVAQEIQIPTVIAGSFGVVQFLSWTEGLFDVHLVFPMYPRSLHDFIQHGS